MISATKLKVMLSPDDMKKYDFEPDGDGDISSRSAFWRIMRAARERCGFDATGSRVFVQYYPERHGGCEMFVTKLTGSRGGDTVQREKYAGEYIIYSFRSMSGMLDACRSLGLSGYVGESIFYTDDRSRGGYYLLIEDESYIPYEYGGVRISDSYYHVLAEHGNLRCTDAICKLSSLA